MESVLLLEYRLLASVRLLLAKSLEVPFSYMAHKNETALIMNI